MLKCLGLLAQLVEQQTLNLQVQGSSPWRPTSLYRLGFAFGLDLFYARVAKLVDALALGASPRKRIGVRVPSLAPLFLCKT